MGHLFPALALALAHSWIEIVRSALVALCLSATAFYVYCIHAARDFFSRPEPRNADHHPPITVLKPIRGLDPEAYANLASFCQQDYPRYQVIFGVCDEHDPGAEVARGVIRDFPHVDIRLVVSGRSIGTNPKVSNLANMEAEAKYPLLLLSDSDIRVGPDHLRAMAQGMADPAVGVVTCMYRTGASRGLAGWIQAVGMSTEFQPGVLVARKLQGIKFAMGAGILIRRSVLAAVGGFAAIADSLADDYLLGDLPARAGYRVELSRYVVDHVVGTRGFRDLIQHEMRWNRGIRISRPWGYAGLAFTHGTASSALLLLTAARSPWAWLVCGATMAMRLSMGWFIGAKHLNDRAAKRFLWLVPLRDLLSFALWCGSFLGDTIVWRGKRFRLIKGGRLIPADALHPQSPVVEVAARAVETPASAAGPKPEWR